MPTLIKTNINRYFHRRSSLPDKSGLFWKIDSGVVRSLTWTEEGEMIVLGIWGKGDIVGSSLSEYSSCTVFMAIDRCLRKQFRTPTR